MLKRKVFCVLQTLYSMMNMQNKVQPSEGRKIVNYVGNNVYIVIFVLEIK